MIFCKSRKSAERTLKNIIPFIEGKLLLKVNRKKTKVATSAKSSISVIPFIETKALAMQYEKRSTKSMCEDGWNTLDLQI